MRRGALGSSVTGSQRGFEPRAYRFESCRSIYGVCGLCGKALACEAGGSGFESLLIPRPNRLTVKARL